MLCVSEIRPAGYAGFYELPLGLCNGAVAPGIRRMVAQNRAVRLSRSAESISLTLVSSVWMTLDCRTRCFISFQTGRIRSATADIQS